MPEFLRLVSPQDALARWMEATPAPTAHVERIPTSDALGRVLAEPVVAPHPLPAFTRSTVDGFAVRAEDTFGAGPGSPAYLRLVGEVHMGTAPQLRVGLGEAAVVHTGGGIPVGADAVVMLEDTQQVPGGEIEVHRSLGIGKNIIQEGEDVRRGDLVIEAGQRLRAQDIGGLMALGFVETAVLAKPRVGILSTGDEVVPPDADPAPGQVRDINTHTLTALVRRSGGEAIAYGIIPDDEQALYLAARKAHDETDLVIITAGSSASARDNTAQVIRRLGEPGVLVHGLAIKPGKPAILGVAGGKPLVGLPGNPVSALVVAGLLVSPMLRRLGGENRPAVHAGIRARLATNVPSEAGREDYVAARLVAGPDGWTAEPIFGKSNLIFTLVRADGLIRIAPEATGLPAGSAVDVVPFD